MEKLRLKPDQLYKKCDVSKLAFESTRDLMPFEGVIGQERAVKALAFGLGMKSRGYNIYLAGERGSGRNTYVKLITESIAVKGAPPRDYLYVNNFSQPDSPLGITLPRGDGRKFQSEMDKTVTKIRKHAVVAFSSKEYESSKSAILTAYDEKVNSIVKKMNKIGKNYGFVFAYTEKGLVSLPLKDDGSPMQEEEFKNLSTDEYEKMKINSNNLGIEASDYFNMLRNEEEILTKKLKTLDEKVAYGTVHQYLEALRSKFEFDHKGLVYMEALLKDMVEHIDFFKNGKGNEEEEKNPLEFLRAKNTDDFFERYRVNVFVDNTKTDNAPVIYAHNPSYYNLVGAVEFRNEMGVLKTDFMHIKPGLLHQANGGYLVINAKDILTAPYAWFALKKALLTGEMLIESLGMQTGYMVTSSLRPMPFKLDVKIVIIGDIYLYSMLYEYDEDFRKLFKVLADFDYEVDRTTVNMNRIAQLIKKTSIEHNIKHFDRDGVARIIEYSSRQIDHKNKMTANISKIIDLIFESEQWARNYGDELVSSKHVEKALHEIRSRNNKIEDKVVEMFREGDYLIDVTGEKIGEINGLAVLGTGQYLFGKPSKITVSTYHGKAGIINIEREARTSGRIHDKGVMILTGYMGYKYAQDKPLTLSASIVFEQLYSGVEGDSASSTELYALLSSLSGLPINQGIGVTGSVNQRGMIQPIGGVNEKIEGFYKICKIKGLTGEQGVIIPTQNVKNLMLSDEVISAVERNEFSIYAVSTIDEGIEILTGVKAGDIDLEGTVHHLVNEKLVELNKSPEDSE